MVYRSVLNCCFAQQHRARMPQRPWGKALRSNGIGSSPFTCVRTWR